MRLPHRVVTDWIGARLDDAWDRGMRKVMGFGDDRFDIFGPGEDGEEDLPAQSAA